MKTNLQLNVRYKETDKMGRVYHSNYFVWFDMARTEYLREAGISYKDMEADGFYFVVAETACKYQAALGFDDHINIETWVTEMKNASVVFEYIITNIQTGRAIAAATTKLASVNSEGKIIPIPENILKKLEKKHV